jgi:RNA polymerase sigma-70 factor (ECF subfamily)
MTYEPLTLDHLLEHQTWALRIARQLVREEHEAEELVQRTWIAAMRRPPDTARGARAWIRRVILNLARERHRRVGTRLRHELASQDASATSPDASESASREEIRELLADRLLALQEPYRTTLTLRYYEDLSSTEIAARLGVPSGTVRWRLKVGLDQLREELDRRCHGDRQRWVSGLLLLVPGARGPADGSRTLDPLPSVSAPAWLTLFGGVGVAAGLAWFLWFQPSATLDAREPALASLAPSIAERDSALHSARTPVEEPARLPIAHQATERTGAVAAELGLPVRVVDAAGSPVSGARIAVVGRGRVDQRATTDEHGLARVDFDASDVGALELPATRGRLSLFAWAPGHAASAYWHVADPAARIDTFVLPLGGPDAPLSGRVVDARGAPVAGARLVWCDQRARVERPSAGDFAGPNVVTGHSEADGSFTLTNLTRGLHGLLVFAEGHAVASFVPGEAAWLEARLPDGAAVVGRVLDAAGTPVSGVRITAEPIHKSNEWTASLADYDPTRRGFPEVAVTDGAGLFRLTCVAPGERTLWAGGEPGQGIASVDLELDEGEEAEWLATLGEGHTLRLRLVDEEGAALEGWLVVLRRPGGTGTWWVRRMTSDAEGRLFIPECPTGDLYLDVLDASGLDSTYLSRKLVAEGQEELLRIPTRDRASVQGTLVDHAGAPALGGKLKLYALRTALTHELERDTAGHFDQRLTAGPYALVLALDLGLYRVCRFELSADERLDLGHLTLPAPGDLRIEAHGFAKSSESSATYSLFALFQDGARENFLPAGSGKFDGEALLTLLPGRYRVLLFDGSGGPPEKHDVTLESSSETRLSR